MLTGISGGPIRWLRTVNVIKVKMGWRRLQVHHIQSERESKNVLQKVCTFQARGNELMTEDRLPIICRLFNCLTSNPFH